MVDSSTIVIWAIALALGVMVVRQDCDQLLPAIRSGLKQLCFVVPRIAGPCCWRGPLAACCRPS